MNNPIFNEIQKRKFNYCHAIEVISLDDLLSTINDMVETFHIDYNGTYDTETVLEFIDSLSICYIEDADIRDVDNEKIENRIHSFDLEKYILESL